MSKESQDKMFRDVEAHSKTGAYLEAEIKASPSQSAFFSELADYHSKK